VFTYQFVHKLKLKMRGKIERKWPVKTCNAACAPAYGRKKACNSAGIIQLVIFLQGCRARLPGKAAGQGCRTRLHAMVQYAAW
jgi:hypothetical protein